MSHPTHIRPMSHDRQPEIPLLLDPGQALRPQLYAITDNGVVTTDVHRTMADALTRLDTLDARFPHHRHGVVPLYLRPAREDSAA